MGILGQLIAGLIVGVLARLLLPGKEAFPDGALGWILTAVLGIAGAFIGTMIGNTLFRENYAAGWLMSIVGAIVLLLLVRLLFGRGNSATV
ncbi:MAG: GlsB/YeaQ/YmgE family stress response membrane protein [Pyrinomonadaceae bacterium]